MPENPLDTAKEMFYKILDGVLDKKEGLDEISKIAVTELLKGYLLGVKGILFKQSDNPYSVKIETLSPREKEYLIKKLEKYAASKFMSEFNKGYMYAWVDYIKHETSKRAKEGRRHGRK